MNIEEPDAAGHTDVEAIVSTLEAQLVKLDQIGAHKAAAHLDTAIHQIKRDFGNNVSDADTAQQPRIEQQARLPLSQNNPARTLTDTAVDKYDPQPHPQVFTLKAKAARFG